MMNNTLSNVSCKCNSTVLTGVCYDFENSLLNGCINAYVDPVDNVTVKCRTCSKALFKDAQSDGTCACKNGYKADEMGICNEICGDGLVLEGECDDNNTVDGDGCSSLC